MEDPMNRTARHRASLAPILGLVALSLAAAGPARGAAGDCVSSNVDHTNTNGLKEYKVNQGNLVGFGGISQSARRSTAIAGADIWNDSANGGTFRYKGTSAATDIPEDDADCVTASVDYSLVVFLNSSDPSGGGARAATFGRCEDGSGDATQFLIEVYALDGSGTPWGWSTGEIAAGEYDLMQTLVHEFGHTQLLGHPGSSEAAVMQPTSNSIGRTRQRDLYQWDLKCSAELSGTRELGGYRRNHQTDGSFIDPEVLYTGSLTATNGTLNISTASGIWRYSSVINENTGDSFFWTDGMYDTGNVIGNIDREVGVFRATTWREDSTIERTIYTDWEDSTAYDWSGTHRLRYVRSSDGFVAETVGALSHCSSMSAWMTCSGTTAMSSGKRVSVAWDDQHSRSVIAWVNQNRQDDSDDRDIKVSVGYIAHTTLPSPTSLGVKSQVSPGLACKEDAAGGYDCVIAYVDLTDEMHSVQVKRFSVTMGLFKYNLSVDATTRTVAESTSSPIAAWYNDGKFWLAFRISTGFQNTRIYESSDGATWTQNGSSWGYSNVGPSVASHYTSGNILLTYK
jgi:hypothetical protein